jgi:hypothetical protein
VSERKRKRYDINEIHDFIDSASTATQNMHYAQKRKTPTTKPQKSVSESTSTRKHAAPSKNVRSSSEPLAPRVVVRKREHAQKKEEIVFRVAESPRSKKKQEVITLRQAAPATQDLFSEEPQYEIEPFTEEQESQRIRRKKEKARSSVEPDVTPAVSLRQAGEKIPEWKPEEQPPRQKGTWASLRVRKESKPLPEFEHVDEDHELPLSHDVDTGASKESLEIEALTRPKPQEKQIAPLTFDEKKRKKALEKQALLELKHQEKEASRWKKEQEKKAILDLRQQKKEQQRLKKVEEAKAQHEKRALEQRQRDEQRLKKEQERKAALELRQQEKETQRRKKEEETKACEEKRILEQRLQEEEHLKKEQEKKAVLELRQQEKEQLRLKKEEEVKAREENRALEQRVLQEERLKKEAEKKANLEHRLQEIQEQRLKREQEKKAIQELRQKEEETQRLKKEEEAKAREEKQVVEQRLREETQRKEDEKKKAAEDVRERQREEHLRLKERAKNLRKEQRELKKKEKEERKRQKVALKRAPPPTISDMPDLSTQSIPTSDEIPSGTMDTTPEEPTSSPEEIHPQRSLEQPMKEEVLEEEPYVSATAPEQQAAERISPREDHREQKRFLKEQKQKQRLARIASKQKEKQERQEQREQKQLPERVAAETIDIAEQKRKQAQEKQARREAKIQERETRIQQKVLRKQEQQAITAQALEVRRKEKEQQQQHKQEARLRRQANAELERSDTRKPQVNQDLQKVIEQQQTNEAEQQVLTQTREQRKLKAVERKMLKEKAKQEKETLKQQMKEEENAKRRMELHFEEQLVKEEQADTGNRVTIFDGFDTIDQDTAQQLYKHGYTSVEKLLDATLDDLKKIGIKKKIAKDILAECLEFVEWKVMDAEKPDEKIGGIF